MKAAWGRILVKLSGEHLAGERGYGISPTVIAGVASDLRRVHELGVLVGLATASSGAEVDVLARDVAMHVAAADPSPVAVERSELPAKLLESERAIYRAQAAQEGKPAKVVDRIVEGKLNKFAAEVCLIEQAFVKDPDRSVGDVVGDVAKRAGSSIRVTGFRRFKLGEASGA